MLRLLTWVVIGIAGAGWAPLRAETIPFDSERWSIQAKEHRLEEHLGRESLYLSEGVAWIKDDSGFQDGEIEFDIAFTSQRGFMGGFWRAEGAGNQEEFYLRPHQTGRPDACQYTPVFNGVTGWQLYHGDGYGTAIDYEYDKWIHVRIVVSGSRGEVFIDSEDPVLAIHELKRRPRPGKVGLKASFAPAHFSNFSYRKIESPALESKPKEPAFAGPGTVMSWSVSSAFPETELASKPDLPAGLAGRLSFETLSSEGNGVANLARVARRDQENNTVLASLSIESDRDQVKAFRFGYSDRVRVYLNDKLLYGGDNGYRTRDFRYLGTIGLFDTLYLPLRKGRNDLRLAVSEDFGGWGVQAAFEEPGGIRWSGTRRP